MENNNPNQETSWQPTTSEPPLSSDNSIIHSMQTSPDITNGIQTSQETPKKSKRPLIIAVSVIGGVFLIVALLIGFLLSDEGEKILTGLQDELLNSDTNSVVGHWSCKGQMEKEYSRRLNLENDGTYMYGAYKDLPVNHYAGTYSVEKMERPRATVLQITLSKPSEFIVNSKAKDVAGEELGKVDMTISMNETTREAAIIFENSKNYYFCVEE